jgi:hypothetical protein
MPEAAGIEVRAEFPRAMSGEMTVVGVGALTEDKASVYFSLSFLYFPPGTGLAFSQSRVNAETKENEHENTDGANVA